MLQEKGLNGYGKAWPYRAILKEKPSPSQPTAWLPLKRRIRGRQENGHHKFKKKSERKSEAGCLRQVTPSFPIFIFKQYQRN